MQPITPEQQAAEQAAWEYYIARRKAMAESIYELDDAKQEV